MNTAKLTASVLAIITLLIPTECLAQHESSRIEPADAQLLLVLANNARRDAGMGSLAWDSALADAAAKHCERMVAVGSLAHRYDGESELSARASSAGVHFSLIEENIALGSFPNEIHEGWMSSPGHRSNLMNSAADHVGIAVIRSGNRLYAVADYSRAVQVLTVEETESRIVKLVQIHGVQLRSDPRDARAACEMDNGVPGTLTGETPKFIFRWQAADLTRLPDELRNRLVSREYKLADVGACKSRGDQLAFTQHRVAVLLY